MGPPPVDNRTRQDRGSWLDWTMLDYEQRRRAHQPPYGEYAVELTRTGGVVGLVGLVPSLMPFGLLPYYATHLLCEPNAYSFPEVGLFWAIATAHQRRGYASEAAAALIAFGFGTLQLARIVATTERQRRLHRRDATARDAHRTQSPSCTVLSSGRRRHRELERSAQLALAPVVVERRERSRRQTAASPSSAGRRTPVQRPLSGVARHLTVAAPIRSSRRSGDCRSALLNTTGSP
jgi:Acetyltransferase (GNAT) domain